MSDYLSHLVDRSLQQATVQPRLASLFERFPDDASVLDLEQREANREDSSPSREDSTVHSSFDSSIRFPEPELDQEVSREGSMPFSQLSLKQTFSLNKLNDLPSESGARLVTKYIALQNEESSPAIAQPQATESPQPFTPVVIYPQIAQPQAIQPTMVSLEKPQTFTDPATPTIHVTIGRVDVRAMTPPPAPRSPAQPSQPQLSLDAYLQSRKGGLG